VTIIDPDRSIALPTEFSRVVFGLTETECLLARRLACGEGIAAAAAHLGVTRHTVYLHLEHIYRKAGVHGHAELIRVLLTPFVSAIPGQDNPAR
jgi:DNA-binding NarL/FixJ family response regulator